MSLFILQKHFSKIFYGFSLLSFLCLGAWSCGNGGGQTVSSQTTTVNDAGTDVSACLDGATVDFTSVFAGPCDTHPGDEIEHTPSDTISYSDLLYIVTKEAGDAGKPVLDCVAKEAYCVGETQCLSIASICQFSVNCGAETNPCLDGTGPCHANKVNYCNQVGTKSECITAYQDECFDANGAFVACDGSSGGTISKTDQHNCFWGVDHETNKTGCFSYGIGYGDSACTK